MNDIISEKEAKLQALQESIDGKKQKVQELNSEIFSVKTEIIKFQNANRLFKHMQIMALEDIPMSDSEDNHFEFNEEHQAIITKKKDKIQPLWNEVEKLEQTVSKDEAIFQEIQDDSEGFSNAIISFKDQIRTRNSEINAIRNQIAFTNSQISEQEHEIKLMSQLNNAAESALASQNHGFDSNNSEILHYQREINSLRSQINIVSSQIEEIKARIDADKEANNDLENDTKNQLDKFNTAVDWKSEKKALTEELQKLHEEIRLKKEEVSHGEKEAFKKQDDLEKYQPLINKWSKKLSSIEVPKETANQLWSKLQIEKNALENQRSECEKEMSQLLINNAKLEDDIKKKTITMKRLIEQFQNDGNRMKKVIAEKEKASDANEKKLLRLIQEAKIKVAQKNLNSKK